MFYTEINQPFKHSSQRRMLTLLSKAARRRLAEKKVYRGLHLYNKSLDDQWSMSKEHFNNFSNTVRVLWKSLAVQKIILYDKTCSRMVRKSIIMWTNLRLDSNNKDCELWQQWTNESAVISTNKSCFKFLPHTILLLHFKVFDNTSVLPVVPPLKIHLQFGGSAA